MNEISLVEALRETLDDRRLSRGERRAVAAMVDRQVKSKQQLDVIRSEAFALAREELTDPQSVAVLEWLEGVVKALEPSKPHKPALRNEAYFTPGDNCPHRLITLLNSCRHTADICVFTITDDEVTEAIPNAHQRGAVVRVISDNHKAHDLGSDVAFLQNKGVQVRVDPTPHHMHHKFAVIDSETLVTGSYNWTRSAARGNFENLVLLQEPRLVTKFVNEFEKIWDVCTAF